MTAAPVLSRPVRTVGAVLRVGPRRARGGGRLRAGVGRRARGDRRRSPAQRAGIGSRVSWRTSPTPLPPRAAIEDVADDAATARALTSDPVWRRARDHSMARPTAGRRLDRRRRRPTTWPRTRSRPLADVAATLSADAFRPTGGAVELSGFIAVQDAARAVRPTRWSARPTRSQRIDTGALVGAAARCGRRSDDDVRRCERAATEALANASVLLAGDARRGRPAQLPRAVPEQRRVALAGRHLRCGGADPDRRRCRCSSPDRTTRLRFAQVRTLGAAARLRGRDDLRAATGPVVPQRHPGARLLGVGRRSRARCGRASTARRSTASSPSTPSRCRTCCAQPARSRCRAATRMTADNAVQLLLNDVYYRYPDPADQNQFFSEATAAIFGALVAGGANPSELLAGARAAPATSTGCCCGARTPTSRRCSPARRSPADCPSRTRRRRVSASSSTTAPGSKMDFYQSVDTAVAWQSCTRRSRRRRRRASRS